MNSREVLEQKIRDIKAQLKAHEAALRPLIQLELMNGVTPSPSTRFMDSRPLDAMREVLLEHGKPMTAGDLRKTLDEGGLNIGKKRAATNFNVSIKASVKNAALTRSGKGPMVGDDEMIGLPEWVKKRQKSG